MRVLASAGLSLALLAVAVFGVAAPPEHCPAATPAELRLSAQASVDWFVRNQSPDGSWLYEYNADTDEVTPASEYNWVRHAGAAMGLYQAAAAGLPGALRSADRGTEWALDRLIEREDWAAFGSPSRVATGASALLAAGLEIRREATGDERYDDVLRRLGRFLAAQTEPSGAVLASYDTTAGRPVPGEYSKYYTGEAYWALARLARAFPDEGFREVADRIGTYLATRRDDAEGHWPPIPDHWAAYGMAETVGSGDRALSGDQADYARRQAELFGAQARWLAQRYGPWGAVVRPGYEPRGGWYGVIGEALTGWWLVAGEEPRLGKVRAAISDRATCIAGLAVDAQSGADDAADATRPGRVEGAWFLDGVTRMDDQQHALSGLLSTIPIAQAEAAGDPGGDPPSALLWAAALLLALNPARAVCAIPRASRPAAPAPDVAAGVGAGASSPAALAAVGGAIGGLAVCLVAAAGDPLLDALDVSEPSFRLAAGIVAVVAGIADLFRRPPSPEPALPGWRAALIPVAVPAVARPALLVMAIGAGADRSVLVTLVSMVVAVALLTGLAAWRPAGGPGDRTLGWARRLLAAGLLACGVLLSVDGLVDV
jgi:small neutral amino acid transporter SnatA (MarC family)